MRREVTAVLCLMAVIVSAGALLVLGAWWWLHGSESDGNRSTTAPLATAALQGSRNSKTSFQLEPGVQRETVTVDRGAILEGVVEFESGDVAVSATVGLAMPDEETQLSWSEEANENGWFRFDDLPTSGPPLLLRANATHPGGSQWVSDRVPVQASFVRVALRPRTDADRSLRERLRR